PFPFGPDESGCLYLQSTGHSSFLVCIHLSFSVESAVPKLFNLTLYAAPFSCSQTVLSNEIPFRRPSLHLVYFVLSLLSFSVQSTAAKLRILSLFSRSLGSRQKPR